MSTPTPSRALIDSAPGLEPPRYGLASVIQGPTDPARSHWQVDGVEYDTDHCARSSSVEGSCPELVPPLPVPVCDTATVTITPPPAAALPVNLTYTSTDVVPAPIEQDITLRRTTADSHVFIDNVVSGGQTVHYSLATAAAPTTVISQGDLTEAAAELDLGALADEPHIITYTWAGGTVTPSTQTFTPSTLTETPTTQALTLQGPTTYQVAVASASTSQAPLTAVIGGDSVTVAPGASQTFSGTYPAGATAITYSSTAGTPAPATGSITLPLAAPANRTVNVTPLAAPMATDPRDIPVTTGKGDISVELMPANTTTTREAFLRVSGTYTGPDFTVIVTAPDASTATYTVGTAATVPVPLTQNGVYSFDWGDDGCADTTLTVPFPAGSAGNLTGCWWGRNFSVVAAFPADYTGDPVTVDILDSGGQVVETTDLTLAAPSANLNVTPANATYTVRYTAPGFVSVVQPYPTGDYTTKADRLTPILPQAVSVTVSSAPDSAFPVTVRSEPGGISTTVAPGQTVVIPNVNPNTYAITASASGATTPLPTGNVTVPGAPLVLTVEVCRTALPTTTHDKPSAQALLMAAGFDPFTVYHRYECNAVGMDDPYTTALRRLALSEWREVERKHWEQLTEATAGGEPYAAVDFKEALGTIELRARATGAYNGLPTLHVPIWVQPYFSEFNLIEDDNRDGVMRTKLGSKIAFYSGFDNNPLDDPGTFLAFATGTVRAFASAPFANEAFEPATNTRTVIAERTWALDHDCLLTAIRMSVVGLG